MMRRGFIVVCLFGLAGIFWVMVRWSSLSDIPYGSVLPTLRERLLAVESSVQEERLDVLRSACANNIDRYISDRYTEEKEAGLTNHTTNNVDVDTQQSLHLYLIDIKHNLVLCPIPKTSTSTMKRIFSILGNKNKGRSVFNISSRGIHRERKSYDDVGTVLGKETFVRKFYALNKARKVLFVRDPYERLFSGYVDRVFGVTENLRPLLQIIFPPKGNSAKKADCRLTFQDLVVYVTSRKTMQVDQHFRPAYTYCYPCHIQYDYVGKLETWRHDAEAILTSVGVDPKPVLGDEKAFDENNDLSILRDIVKRAYEMFHSYNYLDCFTRYQILKRTWVSFQVRGFLSITTTFPLTEKEANNVTTTQFDALVKDAYRKVQDRDSVRQQRQLAMREAYYSLPRPLLLKLQAMFQPDCELFGYQCSVDVRFKESERPKPVFNLETL